ncbi:MAG: DNA adenine methylase [Tenericutes bacterium]|jgi:site-specific DNA-adenine methylase|nr:DNA adenine methylase [Mycoplasmatota bacterium]
MSKRYGIVYMGSKEKILDTIDYIFQREYQKKYFIDLFAGGFSVSGFALQRTKFEVISNDINPYVMGLHREILSGGQDLEQVKYDWISREHFEAVRDNPEKFDNWYVGYVLNVWSFGCNQKDYLYAKDLENDKKALHHAIVFNDFTLINGNLIFEGLNIPETITTVDFKKYPNTKRLAFMNCFKSFIKRQEGYTSYEQLRRMEQMENLSQMIHLGVIKRNITHLDRLCLFEMDWKELYNGLDQNGILNDAVIYCDPPYEDTKQYQFGEDFNYEEFWEWFRNSPHAIYVSSYKAPEDIQPINFALKQVNLDNGNRSNERITKKKKAVENIYWNGKGNPSPTFLDQLFNI